MLELLPAPLQCAHDRGDLHEVRPRADYEQDLPPGTHAGRDDRSVPIVRQRGNKLACLDGQCPSPRPAMKQVVLRNGQPLVAEVPAPSPHPGRVLVANAASVISSGTERAAISDGGGSLPMRAVRNPDLVRLTLRHAREYGIRE